MTLPCCQRDEISLHLFDVSRFSRSLVIPHSDLDSHIQVMSPNGGCNTAGYTMIIHHFHPHSLSETLGESSHVVISW